jgi:hypothetical protein
VADPLRVWLVEHNNPFAAAPGSDLAAVRSGIVATLKQWFLKVVKLPAAERARPTGFKTDAEVQWSDVKDPSKIGDRDLIVYFSPVPALNSTVTKSVAGGPYKDAISQLSNAELVRQQLAEIAKPPTLEGKTLRGAVVYPSAVQVLQTLSEVYVLYDAQSSFPSTRIKDNVDTFATAAFHECAHNKYRPDNPGGKDRVHDDGGGGILAAQYVGQAVNDDNFKFLAQYIWNWGPQYVRGQPVSLMQQP